MSTRKSNDPRTIHPIAIALALTVIIGLASPAPARAAAGFVLVTMGFAWSNYATEALCMAAGAAIKSNTGTAPNYFCVPITNATAPVPAVGGGYGPF
jgi:hypothetical protein